MKIHVHAMIWNEEKMLPYFLRHYETFCEKIFLRVQPSTDKTLEIAKSNSKVIILEPLHQFSGSVNNYNVSDLRETKNNDWKNYSTEDNCDWVILVDCDEFLYHKDLIKILEKYKFEGVTFPKIDGYQMFSENAPTTNKQIYDEIKNGFPMREYCKRVIMTPDISPNYNYGSHSCTPIGNVIESEQSELKLLHYSRQIFGKQELIDYWIKRKQRAKGQILKKFEELTEEEQGYSCLDTDFYSKNNAPIIIDGLYTLYQLTMKNFMRYANTNNVDYNQNFLEVV